LKSTVGHLDSKSDISSSIESLRSYVEGEDFAGYDPYDALNSPIARFLSLERKYVRIAWTQLLRRLPVNIRPLLCIKKGHNPKGLGLFLGGYAKLYCADRRSEYLDKIDRLVELLKSSKSMEYSGNSWGYNFDWQSRAFYLPKYTPTIVNTCFIGHALLDAYDCLEDQLFLDMAVPIKAFLLNDLNREKEGDTFCFSYTPIDNYSVHNANLLGASLLIRLHSVTGEEMLRDAALSSLAYSMKHQRADGSWYYSEDDRAHWVDSFHTGFNLEAIRWFLRCREAEQHRSSYQLGVEYFTKNFFLRNGIAKYHHDGTYPIDIHCACEAIAFLSGEGEEYFELTDRILDWMLTNMQGPAGYFYFRKGRWVLNKVAYMRWSQAWAFRALTEYANNRGSPPGR